MTRGILGSPAERLVFGMDNANPAWPFYRVTDHGAAPLKNAAPQPYDPDGFLALFRKTVGAIDPVVDEYVVEAVQAFNAGCVRSAADMLGCASEKLVLLLCEALETSIADPTGRRSS